MGIASEPQWVHWIGQKSTIKIEIRAVQIRVTKLNWKTDRPRKTQRFKIPLSCVASDISYDSFWRPALSLSVIKMNKSPFISSKSEMKPYHSNCSHFVCRRLSWNFIYGLAAYLHSFLLSADKARCGCIECGHPHNESHGRQFNPIHVTIISIFTFFYYI